MPTYEQILTHYEDGIKQELNIRISDTYDGLIVANALAVTVIQSDSTEEKFEDEGKLASSNYKFKINETSIITANDQACFDLIKTSVDPSVLVMVAVFHNTASPPVIADNSFVGVILSDHDRDELKWNNSEWNETVNPISDYSFTAEPFFDGAFEAADKLSALVSAIDPAWETANVNDRVGHLKTAIYTNTIYSIVSLNTLLRKLADLMETALIPYGNFNILFSRCVLDAQFLPNRWRHLSSGSAFVGDGSTWTVADTYSDEGVNLVIDPDGSPTQEETIWINYNLIKYQYDPKPETAKGMLWEKHSRIDDSFVQLLYVLADNFNLILDIRYTANNTITINFLNRKAYKQGKIYLKDANKAKSKITGVANDPNPYWGRSSYLAATGIDLIDYNVTGTYKFNIDSSPSGRYNNMSQTGDELLLTISPTIVRFNYELILPDRPILQVNSRTYGFPPPSPPQQASQIGIHTAIYMYVAKRAGATDEQNNYWTPCGGVVLLIDNVEKGFNSLIKYLNYVKKRDTKYWEAEYKLTISGWNNFSVNADGSNASINSLQLGSELVFDGISYMVTAIKIKHQKPEIELTLFAAERFDKLESSVAPNPDELMSIPVADYVDVEETVVVTGLTASGNFYAGEYAYDYADSVVAMASPVAAQQGKLKGFFLNSGADGETATVQTRGEYTHPTLTGNIGDFVYLRKVSATVNTSTDYLPDKNANEDLFARVARFITTNKIFIDLKDNDIIE